MRCATLAAAAALALTASGGDPTIAGADVGTITEYPVPTVTSEPRGITVGPDGRLWFAEYHGGKIGRITTGGVIDELTLPAEFAQPEGVTTGPDGNVWFTDIGNGGLIGHIPGSATSGSEAVEIALPFIGRSPENIVTGPDGRIWWTESGGSTGHIGVVATNATQPSDIQEFTVQPGSNPHPVGIVNGPDGKLWFTTNGTSQIGHIAPPGADVPDTDLIPVTSGPLDITLGPDGNLWAAGSGASTITRITPSGTVTEFPTVHPDRLPTGIAAGPDGRIWFTEVGGTTHYIGVMTTDGVMTAADEFTIPGDNPSPQNIVAGPDKRMWFTEFNGNKIGAITTGQEAPGGGGQQPPPDPGGGNPPGAGQGPGVPVGCSPNKLILTDVYPKGGKTRLLGVAPAGSAGKKVTFVSTWNNRTVARATVGADLSFSASAPLPPARLRSSNRARYRVKLGKTRTNALKFARRMYTTAVRVSGRSVTFSGVVTKPFAKPPQQITIRASASCSSIGTGTIVATVKPSASGAFTAHFDLPAGQSTIFLRASTRVRKHTTSKNTFPTFTLVRGVRLAS